MNTPETTRSARARVVAWLYRHRWLLAITVAALVLRLHWNLMVHPLGDYVVSDMRGYDVRSTQLLTNPWKKIEYHGFFPYGAHYVVAAVKWLFGRYNYPAISVAYALMGTITVSLAYLIAARVSRHAWVPPLLGLILIPYYPIISLGGYMLSETPFAVFLMAATYSLVCLAQDGKARQAWLAGLWVGCATAVRPQVMISVALFGLLWLVARKRMPKIRLAHLVMMAAPLAAILAFSSYRLHHHTGRRGLVSENGTFNLAFGRCHARKIMSTPKGEYKSHIMFGPPPLIQLEHRAERNPNSWVQLGAALGPELEFPGFISDKQALNGFIKQCVEKTGWLGQLKYSVINVMLLSAYNTAWPDSGQGLWRKLATSWGKANLYAFTFPALLGMILAFRRRELDRLALVAIHPLGLMILAFIVFGGARLRASYDPLIILLALEGYAFLALGGYGLVRKLMARRGARS